MKSFEYINEVKRILGYTSYKISKETGISQSALSQYLNESRYMDNYACFKIAEMLDIDPKIIISRANAEREKEPEKREFWLEKVGECGYISIGYALFSAFCSLFVVLGKYILCKIEPIIGMLGFTSFFSVPFAYK